MATSPNDAVRHKHKIPLLGKTLDESSSLEQTASMAFTTSSRGAKPQAEPQVPATRECRRQRRRAKKIPCRDELVGAAERAAARMHARIDLHSMD